MLSSKEVIITGEKARYLCTVLRIQPGESISVFDGHGHRHLCRILKVYKKVVVAEKIKEEQYSTESPLQITIAQGIPKSDKMDLIIQKSTELGVRRLIPLITERSQIRHTKKTMRWKRVAISASQQSGRETIPEIEEPVDFKEFINRQEVYKGIIFSEEERERNLKKILKGFKGAIEFFLLIGPEGGFSKEEIAQAVKKGFIKASMGPRILRTETAAITALGIIQYELGDVC